MTDTETEPQVKETLGGKRGARLVLKRWQDASESNLVCWTKQEDWEASGLSSEAGQKDRK